MSVKRASALRKGDRIMGFPTSPLTVAKRARQMVRDHKPIGWRIHLEGTPPLEVNGDPLLEVDDTPTDGSPK